MPWCQRMIALWVDDARAAFHETTQRGAEPFMEPTVEKDEFGEVVRAGIVRDELGGADLGELESLSAIPLTAHLYIRLPGKSWMSVDARGAKSLRISTASIAPAARTGRR